MAVQTIFKRYELKYLLTEAQKEAVLQAMAEHMELDQYGRTTIRNIYFDTENYRLIRHSIDKPVYKEKLRIRSYQRARSDSTVYVELKKKFDDIVYKRRLGLYADEAMQWLSGKCSCRKDTQISAEVDHFLNFYQTLHPVVFLSCEREAYYSKDGSDFRVTFDDQILCRQTDISLDASVYGTPLLPPGTALMEIKCSGGIPLWMTKVLSRERIYKTSFSKYGTAYQTMIYPTLRNKTQEVSLNA